MKSKDPKDKKKNLKSSTRDQSQSSKKKQKKSKAATPRTVRRKIVKKKQPQKARPVPKVRKVKLVRKKSTKEKGISPRLRVREKKEKVTKPPHAESVAEKIVEVVQPPVLPSESAEATAIPASVSIETGAEEVKPEIVPSLLPEVETKPPELKELELEFPISVKELSVKLQIKPSRLIQELIRMNIFATINQLLSQEDTTKICEIFGFEAKAAPDKEEQILSAYRQEDALQSLRLRPPVVTLMGHVDHGKTSLLDVIKKTNIADAEHGGITQHIGAYEVALPKGKITFLDTPGHEAFTAMRSHGAHITDIVVLVVAADDGVMPQTIEAINHAQAANAPIIVAINKIDKPQADVDRVKKQLSELGLRPEDWQGKTIAVGVSAKTGEGVDELLEMILLEAEMLELKANYQKPASGVVIESRQNKNRGPLATLLVEEGTLRLNDTFISGLVYAKVKAMFNDHGRKIDGALPGTPVEVLGLTGLPEVGEDFLVVTDERQAREIISLRQGKERKHQAQPVKRRSLEELHSDIKQGKIKELKIIIKADVSGSLEAVRNSLEKLEIPEVKFQIIHAGIGPINTSDAMLAKVADAFILGFHVQPDERAKGIIEQEGIEVRIYNIIYELISEIRNALEGMLEPTIKKVFVGRAQVRKVFKLSRTGIVAGSFVSKGKILRSATINLVRNGQIIFEGKISNLKRYKDDVREIAEGFECGISLVGFQDYQEGDIIEAYTIQKTARKL